MVKREESVFVLAVRYKVQQEKDSPGQQKERFMQLKEKWKAGRKEVFYSGWQAHILPMIKMGCCSIVAPTLYRSLRDDKWWLPYVCLSEAHWSHYNQRSLGPGVKKSFLASKEQKHLELWLVVQ